MRQLIMLMQEVLFSGCGCIIVCPLRVYSLNIQVYIWFAYFLAYGQVLCICGCCAMQDVDLEDRRRQQAGE